MTPDQLTGRRVAIWGLGKEGREAARLLADRPFVFLDDAESGPDQVDGHSVHRGAAALVDALLQTDVLIKSPGVSLYRPEIAAFQARGGIVTSLLNLWNAARTDRALTLAITGTKGKSTTAALLAHVLAALGRRVVLAGNIGVPVTEIRDPQADTLVLELSSYQTADFSGRCDLALVTSLYPEHLNWHGDEARYYRDKLALLNRAGFRLAHAQVRTAAPDLLPPDVVFYDAFHGPLDNAYLARPHNRANVGGVLAVVNHLGLSREAAFAAMRTFQGLPHRQQELGTRDGILYVDDSISTTPQSAIAAMSVYHPRPITLIAGGFDRGVDLRPLVDALCDRNGAVAVVCLGASGARLFHDLRARDRSAVFLAEDMPEAVGLARHVTPSGGVILLSPAAPSFGLFRDYMARGAAFAQAAGFGHGAP